MAGHTVLLNLLGGIALLLWATRMVRTGVLRALGERFRRALGQATANPISAFLTGVGIASAVQSSAATGLIVVSFAERGLITLAAALAVMLGADVGSTLVVQALSFNLSGLIPMLLIAGVAAFMAFENTTVQNAGRIVIGLALMILSLQMVVAASAELRGSAVLAMVLQRLGDDPILAVIVGAVLTWLFHSSVAMVLLVISLTSVAMIPPVLGMALVLGANVGSGLIPIGLSLKGPPAATRVLFGNFAFRLAGAIVALLLLSVFADRIAAIESDPARQIANFHTLFNLVLALVFLPLAGLAARLLERLIPEAKPAGEPTLAHLDESLLDRPGIALGSATREVMRLADMVEIMLRETILAFGPEGERRREAVKRLDDPVDRLQEEIKLYLTRLTRNPLSEEDSRRAFDLILFTTNLEHIGDIIDKSLLELAAKKLRLRLAFSPEGWTEIQELHARVVDQMRLAMTVFVTRDLKMARQLVLEKDNIRLAERGATESHLRRLREGTIASIETSALHLDILRDLKRINAHITSVAYPILEASGELRESRLRVAAE
ncbi:MAG: Na/Pi cotransporter family protein [Microvirga sp.]|nr:Na/Pi cotransporter family protein [Microvirga sp.]